MNITKDNNGKWIRPERGKYLTVSNGDDKFKPIIKTVILEDNEPTDLFVEITEQEAEKIRIARGDKMQVEIPQEYQQSLVFAKIAINHVEMSDSQALEMKNLFPRWEEFINSKLPKGYKVLYNGLLYKVKQDITTVLENQAPSIDTAALYEEINETNAGTKEDPIPYNNNMELFSGKYYSQDGKTYKCTRDTENTVYQNLSDLVGIYVEVSE